MNKLLFALLLILVVLLNACDSGGKYAAFDDKKILDEYRKCLNTPNNKMSPARGVACTNYDKECLRRKKSGNNICAI
jgi:hypothetical protein